jgi:hypothetical protein
MRRQRRIRIKAIPNKEPNVRLYVLALLELAKQLQEEPQADREADQTRNQEDEL